MKGETEPVRPTKTRQKERWDFLPIDGGTPYGALKGPVGPKIKFD